MIVIYFVDLLCQVLAENTFFNIEYILISVTRRNHRQGLGKLMLFFFGNSDLQRPEDRTKVSHASPFVSNFVTVIKNENQY